MRLLVVEDDPKMASLIKRGLEREGYAVDVAAEGEQAIWAGIEFPYVEGLRLDEAMNELTLMTTGIYGKPLPRQHGAPLRLIADVLPLAIRMFLIDLGLLGGGGVVGGLVLGVFLRRGGFGGLGGL